MSTSARRKRRTALGVTIAAFLLAGCGDDPGDAERALDAEEAGLLAGALFENLQDEGAAFEVTFEVSGTNVLFTGSIDWVNHAGTGQVAYGDAPPYDVVWTDDAVLERLPGLAERVRGADWVVRRPDPSQYRLDTVISILVGLASTTPDNPVNLQQQDDVRFLKNDKVSGDDVLVMRSGGVEFWIDDRGDVRRVDAPIRFTDDGARIDLHDRGAVDVELPARNDVVDVVEIPGDYAELTQLGVL